MEHARAIHRDLIRGHRRTAFVQADGDYMRAVEMGDHHASNGLARDRRRLRDLPADPAIDKAKTIDELKAIWPKELPPLT
jgi:hypothetical protein